MPRFDIFSEMGTNKTGSIGVMATLALDRTPRSIADHLKGRTDMQCDAVGNHLGSAAYLFDDRRDHDIARRIAEHYARLEATGEGRNEPLDAAAAERHARAAGLSAEEIGRLMSATPFVQMSNNLREYFISPQSRPFSATSRFAATHLDLKPGDRLLDAGCSAGGYLLRAAPSRADLVGVDLSLLAMEAGSRAWTASQQYRQPEWHAANVLDMPLESSSCSHVTSFVVLTYVPIRAALAEIRRVLKPGGTLLFTVEGPGFIGEVAQKSRLASTAGLGLARWYAGHKLMQLGIDWQGKPGIGRLAGCTTYDAATIRRIVTGEGFSVELADVLTRHKGRERLVGVVARKR